MREKYFSDAHWLGNTATPHAVKWLLFFLKNEVLFKEWCSFS